MSEAMSAAGGRDARRILFVTEIAPGDRVLMAFQDPAPKYAVYGKAESLSESKVMNAADLPGSSLDVLILSAGAALTSISPDWFETPPQADAAPALLVRYRGVELMCRPGRATLQCEPELTETLLAAVVDFTHYERELRKIELEVASAWPELEQDKALAYEAGAGDLARSREVGGRVTRAFQRRIECSRIEPHLYAPDVRLSAAGQKLGEELREKARIEARLEAIDGQMEVFEHIYEMASQRLGEFRSSHQEHLLEWVIIALLTLETLFMLAGTIAAFRK